MAYRDLNLPFCVLQEASNGPTYHVAYRDLNQPERRTTKGWTAMDDSIKGARGTSTGKVHSSLAQRSQAPAPGSMLQPLYTTYPNETRLQVGCLCTVTHVYIVVCLCIVTYLHTVIYTFPGLWRLTEQSPLCAQ